MLYVLLYRFQYDIWVYCECLYLVVFSNIAVYNMFYIYLIDSVSAVCLSKRLSHARKKCIFVRNCERLIRADIIYTGYPFWITAEILELIHALKARLL